LSDADLAALQAALEQARTQLATSNETISAQSTLLKEAEDNLKASNVLIEQQSRTLTLLWIGSGALVLAAVLEAVVDLVTALK
jgi:hypothetical protein